MTLKDSIKKIKQEKPALSRGSFFQAKLKVNQPSDRYEQEANKIAQNISSVNQKDAHLFFKPQISRVVPGAENHQKLAVPEQLEASLKEDSESGSSLPKELGSTMESKLSYDFSDVKIHHGQKAEEASSSLNAKAFTYGNDIYFNSNKYNPDSREGKELLSHELTHVVQQNASPATQIQRDEEETTSENSEEQEFDFDYNLLPPALQFSLGQWMLEANTSQVALQFTHGLLRSRFGYNYGGNLTLGARTPSRSAELGFNPHSPAVSFGFSQDQFRLGANADLTTGGFGLNFGYGARLLPMPFDLADPVNRGWGGASGILGDIGSMQDPISFYQSHGDNIDDVMAAVKALQPLANEENRGFGAGLRFSYNPQTGVLIHAGAQWMF